MANYNTKKVKDILESIAASVDSSPNDLDFAPPEDVKEEALKIHNKLLEQKKTQRDGILSFIENMAAASLIFLVFIILFQMITRLFIPDYNGVSDVVINILTVGVFGQIIGIVATITAQVWKDPKKPKSKT